ncbi:MAG: hypothetical protein FWE06_00945 [Oscillospiraceae bacterium]|nr:hypothetical protein [Oscillospiraceae bacterium]
MSKDNIGEHTAEIAIEYGEKLLRALFAAIQKAAHSITHGYSNLKQQIELREQEVAASKKDFKGYDKSEHPEHKGEPQIKLKQHIELPEKDAESLKAQLQEADVQCRLEMQPGTDLFGKTPIYNVWFNGRDYPKVQECLQQIAPEWLKENKMPAAPEAPAPPTAKAFTLPEQDAIALNRYLKDTGIDYTVKERTIGTDGKPTSVTFYFKAEDYPTISKGLGKACERWQSEQKKELTYQKRRDMANQKAHSQAKTPKVTEKGVER